MVSKKSGHLYEKRLILKVIKVRVLLPGQRGAGARRASCRRTAAPTVGGGGGPRPAAARATVAACASPAGAAPVGRRSSASVC